MILQLRASELDITNGEPSLEQAIELARLNRRKYHLEIMKKIKTRNCRVIEFFFTFHSIIGIDKFLKTNFPKNIF
jgi:hypothetical protein